MVMPKKARKAKRSMKRKGGKRKGYNKYNISKDISQHFPPALRTKLTMNTTFPMSGVTGGANNNATFAYFKHNSILNCGPSLQSTATLAPGDYTGTFPSGINYLLAQSQNTNTLTAARAPYNSFLVIGSSIRLLMTSDQAGNTHSVQAVIYKSSENYGGSSGPGIGQSVENLGEQPGAVSCLIPPETTSKAIILKTSSSTKKIFGLTRNVATNDKDYIGTWQTSPAGLSTYIIAMNNAGSGTINEPFDIECKVTIVYDVIFFDRNMFGSVVPI